MIRAFLLRVIRQAVEEFLTPQFEALRAELHGGIEALRAELRSEIGALRAELRGEIEALRTEMRSEIEALRSEMRTEIENLRVEVNNRLDAIDHRLANLEEDAKAHGVQLARLDQRVIDLKESLDVERRLVRLEAHTGLGKE